MAEFTPSILLATGEEVLVDPEDLHLAAHLWHRKGSKGYAYNTTLGYLHRVICPSPPGMHTDHINGNAHDCRRSNLRSVTPSINRRNVHGAMATSGTGVLGVCAARGGKFQAYYLWRYLGIFNTLEEARQARLEAEVG